MYKPIIRILLLVAALAGCGEPRRATGHQTAFFSVFLYPGENMLILADDKLIVDTLISTPKRLKYVELPIAMQGVKKIRILTLFQRKVYLDTTVSNEYNIELFGFSKPYLEQEVRDKKAVLTLPAIGEATRRLTVIDGLNSKNYPKY